MKIDSCEAASLLWVSPEEHSGLGRIVGGVLRNTQSHQFWVEEIIRLVIHTRSCSKANILEGEQYEQKSS